MRFQIFSHPPPRQAPVRMPLVPLKLVSILLLAITLPAGLACGGGDEAASVAPPVPAAEAALDTSRAALPADAGTAAAERLPARGIDVSHYQGRIDWRAV